MSIIDFEVEEIQKLCENVVPNSKIITCSSTPPQPLVRVDIRENKVHRQLTACLRFPEEYPNQTILVELKSKFLCGKFLDGLASLCETEAQKYLGKPQVLHILRFVQKYLHDNPLCVCVGEIQQLRGVLGANFLPDQLKLKQRSSTVQLTAKGGAYYYRVRTLIPEEYPQRCIELEQPETNLPAVLVRYLNGQSHEIARQCVEPPLRVGKDKQSKFQPVPSLYLALKFCIESVRDFHTELCPICDSCVLPEDPKQVELDDSKDSFVERVYCGHLFHQVCLKNYLQEPPFPKGGKLCPAKRRHPRSDATSYYFYNGYSKPPAINKNASGTCGMRLAHDRWVVSIKIAESRWAQKQARQRELDEVADFLQ